MRKLITLMICMFILNSAKSQLRPEMLFIRNEEKKQKGFAVGRIEEFTSVKKTLQNYLQITDTIESNHKQWDLVKIEGSDFEFVLRIHRDSVVVNVGEQRWIILESHSPPFPLFRYDVTSLDTDELKIISRELREMSYDTIVLRQAFQTCFSYSFESIIRSHGIDTEPIFFRRSVPAYVEDVETILEKLFVKIETIPDIRRRTLRRSEHLDSDQVLILFRNINGEPLHACFNLEGRTWTKNGNAPYTSHLSPFPVIDQYNRKNKIRSDFSETTKEFLIIGSVASIEIYQFHSDLFD